MRDRPAACGFQQIQRKRAERDNTDEENAPLPQGNGAGVNIRGWRLRYIVEAATLSSARLAAQRFSLYQY